MNFGFEIETEAIAFKFHHLSAENKEKINYDSKKYNCYSLNINAEELCAQNFLAKKIIFKVSQPEKKEEENRIFRCNIANCKKQFNKKFLLSRHLVCHLKKLKIFKCDYLNCSKVYKSKENMNFHYQNIHLKIKPFKCKFCEASFSHRNGKNYHERKIHQNKLDF